MDNNNKKEQMEIDLNEPVYNSPKKSKEQKKQERSRQAQAINEMKEITLKQTNLNDASEVEVKYRKVKCKSCGETVELRSDVCPLCGHYLKEGQSEYEPISKEKAKKIRWVLFGILMVAAIIILLINGTIKSCGETDSVLLPLIKV